jgi:hypothetical protein
MTPHPRIESSDSAGPADQVVRSVITCQSAAIPTGRHPYHTVTTYDANDPVEIWQDIECGYCGKLVG